MKICLISNLYPPYNRGGAEQVVKNTVEGLVGRGHQVVVITARPFRAGPIFNFQFFPTLRSGSRLYVGTIFNQFSNPNDQSPNPKFQTNLDDQNSSFLIPHSSFLIHRFFPFNLFFYGHDYKYPSWVRFFWHIFDVFNLHSYFVIRWILKKEKPDIVHTHNLKGLGYLIPAAIRSLGIFHVHTLHDVQLVEPSGVIIKGQEKSWRYHSWPVRLYAAICRRLFGSPEIIISPSKFLLEFYEKRGFFPRSKKVVLPNPVICHGEESHYDIASEAKQSREFPDERDCFGRFAPSQYRDERIFNFLYLGQIEEHKGVLFLIRAFRGLFVIPTVATPSASLRVNSGSGVEESLAIHNFKDPSAPLRSARDDNLCLLHIVGTGSRLEEARQLAADCPDIIFHGKVERESLPEIFQQADITIVPSLCYENSPTVIFESFSFGKPVLASSIEGVAELIRPGENGLTFEAGNESSLLEKLRWGAENPEKIRGMGQAAAKSVEGLGLEPYLDKLLDLCYNKELN